MATALPISPGCFSAPEPPSTRSPIVSWGKGTAPLTITSGEDQDRFWATWRKRGSRRWWKSTRQHDPTPGIWSSYDESPETSDEQNKEDSRNWAKDTHRSR